MYKVIPAGKAVYEIKNSHIEQPLNQMTISCFQNTTGKFHSTKFYNK